jgi:hypothetical protein
VSPGEKPDAGASGRRRGSLSALEWIWLELPLCTRIKEKLPFADATDLPNEALRWHDSQRKKIKRFCCRSGYDSRDEQWQGCILVSILLIVFSAFIKEKGHAFESC